MTLMKWCLTALVVAVLVGVTAAFVITRALVPQEAHVAPADPDVASSTADQNAQRVVAILRGLTAAEDQLRALRQELDEARSKGQRKSRREQ